MPVHRRIGRAIKKGIKKLNERAKREAAARQNKQEGANPFSRIERLDPEPTRTAQDRRRAGR